jgi:hypothetical protein
MRPFTPQWRFFVAEKGASDHNCDLLEEAGICTVSHMRRAVLEQSPFHAPIVVPCQKPSSNSSSRTRLFLAQGPRHLLVVQLAVHHENLMPLEAPESAAGKPPPGVTPDAVIKLVKSQATHDLRGKLIKAGAPAGLADSDSGDWMEEGGEGCQAPGRTK